MATRNQMGLLSMPSTADVMAGYEEPNPLKKQILGLLSPAMHFTLDQILRDQRLARDPTGEIGNRLTAAGAGAVSVPDDIASIFGQQIYGPETRGILDQAMAGDQQSAFGGAVMTPIPAGSVARGIAAAPRASTAGIAGAGLLSGAAEAGDDAYSQKRLKLTTEQGEIDSKLETLRREIAESDAKAEEEINSISSMKNEKDKRAKILEWQRKAKITDDGIMGSNTRAAIKSAIRANLEKNSRDLIAQYEGRYGALKDEITRLDEEESPEAIRKRTQSSRIAQLYPSETGLAQGGLVLGGLLSDIATRGKGRGAYNKAVRSANEAAAKSATQAERMATKGDVAGATREAAKAGSHQDAAFAARDSSGLPWGTVAGMESAAFGPDIVDYARASWNDSDELKHKVLDSVVGDPAERQFPGQPLLERAGVTTGGGLVLGKLAKHMAGGFMPKEFPQRNPGLQVIDDQASGLIGNRASAMADDIAVGMDANARAQAAMQQPRGLLQPTPQPPVQPPQTGLLPPPQSPQGGGAASPANTPAAQVGGLPTNPQSSHTPGQQLPPSTQAASSSQSRAQQVSPKRKDTILAEMASGRTPSPQTNKEYDYIQDLLRQADGHARLYGVSRSEALQKMLEMIKSGSRTRPWAVAGATAAPIGLMSIDAQPANAAPRGLLDMEGYQ